MRSSFSDVVGESLVLRTAFVLEATSASAVVAFVPGFFVSAFVSEECCLARCGGVTVAGVTADRLTAGAAMLTKMRCR